MSSAVEDQTIDAGDEIASKKQRFSEDDENEGGVQAALEDHETAASNGAGDVVEFQSTKAIFKEAMDGVVAKWQEKRSRDQQMMETFKSRFEKLSEELMSSLQSRVTENHEKFAERFEVCYAELEECLDLIVAHEEDLAAFKSMVGGAISRIAP